MMTGVEGTKQNTRNAILWFWNLIKIASWWARTILSSWESKLPPSVQYFEYSNAEVQKTCGKVARLTMCMEINFMIIDMWFLREMMI